MISDSDSCFSGNIQVVLDEAKGSDPAPLQAVRLLAQQAKGESKETILQNVKQMLQDPDASNDELATLGACHDSLQRQSFGWRPESCI